MPWATTRPPPDSRGYGVEHRRARAEYKKIVDQGQTNCVRCNQWINPHTPWHLDHSDYDRTQYIGAAHAACNVRAGARKGRRMQNQQQSPNTQRW